MQVSVWLSVTGIFLAAWYLVWKAPLRRSLGIDPFRATPSDLGGRTLPTSLLVAGQVALLVGMAPLYSMALLLRFGLLPALIWLLAGSLLLSALPHLAALWAAMRSGGKGVGALMFVHLGGRGKQLMSMLGWLLAVMLLVMSAGAVSSGFDRTVQTLRPDDYLADEEGYRQAQADAQAAKALLDVRPYLDSTAYDQALRNVTWEAQLRGIAATAVLGLMAISCLYGYALFMKKRIRRHALFATLLALALTVGWMLLSQQLPIRLTQETWMRLLLLYALLCALMPMRWMAAPRDALSGLLVLSIALLCFIGALFKSKLVTQPGFVAWHTESAGDLLPYAMLTTLAGGANAVYLLSTAQRSARYAEREHAAYPIAFGGTLLACFVGVMLLVAVGQYKELPLAALQGVFTSPRLLMGAMATLLTSVGLSLQVAALWVSVAFLGCALGALDMAVRLGASLMHSIYFNQGALPRPFSLDRLLSAIITVIAAFLLSNVEYWLLWPLFGAVSLGLCAVALLPIIVWLRDVGRRVWWALAAIAGLLAGLSLWTLGASLLAQLRPSAEHTLSADGSGSLFLHAVVATLLVATMVHALTGIGRAPRDLPPMHEDALFE